MFQGLWFLCKFGWKSEKRYILYNMFYQLIQSILPLIAVAAVSYTHLDVYKRQAYAKQICKTLLAQNGLLSKLPYCIFIVKLRLGKEINARGNHCCKRGNGKENCPQRLVRTAVCFIARNHFLL